MKILLQINKNLICVKVSAVSTLTDVLVGTPLSSDCVLIPVALRFETNTFGDSGECIVIMPNITTSNNYVKEAFNYGCIDLCGYAENTIVNPDENDASKIRDVLKRYGFQE